MACSPISVVLRPVGSKEYRAPLNPSMGIPEGQDETERPYSRMKLSESAIDIRLASTVPPDQEVEIQDSSSPITSCSWVLAGEKA